jgi:iron complex transport system substrate-binding protein
MKYFSLVFAALLFSSAQLSAQRIITAGSAITETVCALGDCDKIVASDKTSLFPEQIQQLPSIGYRSSISTEGIVSLKPDLFIAERGYVEESVLTQLASSGINLVVIDRQLSIEDTKRYIAKIAGVLNREVEGKKLIATIDEALVEANRLLQETTTKPKVLCIYNRGTATVTFAGKNTFQEIVPLSGGVSALPDVNGYKPLNTESLIAANPDYILMAQSGFESLGGLNGVLKLPGVAQTTAGKKKQIIYLDTLVLSNFGPRVGMGILELVKLLHPEIGVK